MYNFKSVGGTFKGLAGECMFKAARKYAWLTSFFPLQKFMDCCEGYLTLEQAAFIRKYWRSIDCIEIDTTEERAQPVIYEIKTKNYIPYRPKHWKPKMTEDSLWIYEQAGNVGFAVQLAVVTLYDGWNYEVEIVPLTIDRISVHRPEKYTNAKIMRGGSNENNK